MMRLLSLLIREGTELLLMTELRRAQKRFAALIALYAAVGVLGAAALGFFYLLLYRLLAERLDDVRAAAILCGGNLLLIAALFAVRGLGRSRRRSVAATGRSPADDPVQSMLDLGESALDAGIALGRQLDQKARKAAPAIVLGVAVIGLIIGARPQILSVFRRARPRTPPN